MKIYGYDFPNIFMKFSSKRAYLEDLHQGCLYLNESGYFRSLEDNYRGDRYDGKCPISIEKYGGKLILGPADGSGDKIEIPISTIHNFQVGFSEDDKIPMYCCSMLSEDILDKIDQHTFIFRKDFLAEMHKFGEYVAFFSGDEIVKNIRKYIEDNDLIALHGPVNYLDIKSAYSLEMLNDDNRDQYAPFFNKDLSYRWQNEWRILFLARDRSLIENNANHFCMQLPPLEWFHVLKFQDLEKHELIVRETPDTNSNF